MSQPLELENGIPLFCLSMGKAFRVHRICNTVAEANTAMERDNKLTLIACDEQERCYLAEQYGSKVPSELLVKLLK